VGMRLVSHEALLRGDAIAVARWGEMGEMAQTEARRSNTGTSSSSRASPEISQR